MTDINSVEVPAKVFDGIEAVRRSGRTNMLDLPEVVRIAVEMDFVETAMWIESNRTLYSRALFQGFTIIDEGSDR